MTKIENKLKRLTDLGDINTSKQTQIYLDALGELSQINPQMSSVLTLIQTGMSQSFQYASFAPAERPCKTDPT